MTAPNYTAVIRLEEELWLAECPEAGTVGQGGTPEETLARLQEITKLYLKELGMPSVNMEGPIFNKWRVPTFFSSASFATQQDLEEARRQLRQKPSIGTPESDLYRSSEPWCDPELLAALRQQSEDQDTNELGKWQAKHAGESLWLEKAPLENAYLNSVCLEDVKMTQAHLEKADLYNARLDEADLRYVHFENAYLGDIHLKGADLRGAYCQKADFEGSHLENADLRRIHLEGVSLVDAHLEGADFSAAIVDEETILTGCSIDDKTNFTMVGLDSARVEPRLLAALKTNIRRIAWTDWYNECKAKRKTSHLGLLSKIIPPLLDNGFIFLALPLLLLFAWPVWGACRIVAAVWRSLTQYGVTASFMKPFWWISDYGSSTKRVLGTFLATVLIFTCLYAILEGSGIDILDKIAMPEDRSFASLADWLVKLFFFSFATMLTLGFGNINVALESAHPWLGMSIVAVNLFSGYFLLAVLVTRIGILFQSLGPEQEVERAKGRSSGKGSVEA